MQTACRRIPVGFTAARPIALIRVAALTPFIAYLARSGFPVHELLATANLPPQIFDHGESLMPAAGAIGFMEDAASAHGIEHLGVRAGAETPIGALGVFGRLIAAAGTLETAIEALVRLAPAFDSGSRWWTERRGGRAWLCHEVTVAGCSSHRQADLYWLGIALNLLRGAAGCGWRPDAISLQASETPGVLPADVVGGAPVTFSQAENAIAFPVSLLGRSMPRPSTAPSVDGNDLDRWSSAAPASDFLESIGQVIATLSSSEYPRIDTVARAIGTGVRTLQRRLAEVGASYERMLARLRLGTAAHLLASTDATVLDIALDVGYSDHAHFTRAFRRWTGVPPREFRKNGRANGTMGLAMARRA